MAVTYTTTQIASLAANAGLTQNISVSSPSALALFNSGSSTGVPTGQSGPGWATPTGSSSTIATPAASGSMPSWATWAIIAALAYFGLKKLGG
jgi:hypothetical protein